MFLNDMKDNNVRVIYLKHAKELFLELLDEAIDLSENPKFNYYKSMTTAHAQRVIIELLKENTLYRYRERILIRMYNRLCYIVLNKLIEEDEETIESVKVSLPFSPKHICNGYYRNANLRAIEDYFQLSHIINALVK